MKAADVTAKLEDALIASACDRATVAHRPRPLSDNGSSYISGPDFLCAAADSENWLACGTLSRSYSR